MDLKEDVIKAIQNGQGVDRNIHLTTIAKQSIEDAVEEAYNKRNETLAREGRSLLPPRSRNDWQHLGVSELFKLIPPLLKVNIDVKKDPISDCLFQIRYELEFTYMSSSRYGESKFHVDLNEIFSNSKV